MTASKISETDFAMAAKALEIHVNDSRVHPFQAMAELFRDHRLAATALEEVRGDARQPHG